MWNSKYHHRGELNPWVKCSVCFVLEFALPPFSPPLPSVAEVSKQNRHWTFDPMINFTPVEAFHSMSDFSQDTRQGRQRKPVFINVIFVGKFPHFVFWQFFGFLAQPPFIKLTMTVAVARRVFCWGRLQVPQSAAASTYCNCQIPNQLICCATSLPHTKWLHRTQHRK